MWKRRKRKKKPIAERLTAEYNRGYAAGYIQGCKDGGGAAEAIPICYERARDGKWYVRQVEDEKEEAIR